MEPQHFESLYPATSREKEIAQIFSFIKTGKSVQLIALPGVGRANTLGLLAYNRSVRVHHIGEKEQANYHFVLCNFSEMKNRPLFDVIKFIFLELTSSLHERRREEEFLVVDKLFKDALSYQDELVLFQELKHAIDFLSLEKGIIIILLFERFETYVSQASGAFFNNLRSMRSRAKYHFSIVFSTTRPLEDMLGPDILADFYEFIADNHVYLSLKDDIGLHFRIKYLENLTGKKLSDTTISSLLSETSGHGKLTRLGLEALLSGEKADKDVSETFLLNLKTVQGALAEIWLFLTPDEQQDMLTLCKNESCPLPNTFLKDIGLIAQEKITIPLFKTFVGQKKPHTALDILFDPTTNTIKRGENSISDILTNSEFRLLRLLLEEQSNLVDREKIIQAVWSDSKTQSGVSEQALDQLIFRLRKKLEDDPTNPTHILTVKGRGVKFVQ